MSNRLCKLDKFKALDFSDLISPKFFLHVFPFSKCPSQPKISEPNLTPLCLLWLISALSGGPHGSAFKTYLEFKHFQQPPWSLSVLVITFWVVFLLTLLPPSRLFFSRSQRIFTNSSHRRPSLCSKPSSSACFVNGETPVASLWWTRSCVASEDHSLSSYLFALPHSAPDSLVPPLYLLFLRLEAFFIGIPTPCFPPPSSLCSVSPHQRGLS